MKHDKINQQNSKTQSDKKTIVKGERPIAKLHPLFSGMFKRTFPAMGGK